MFVIIIGLLIPINPVINPYVYSLNEMTNLLNSITAVINDFRFYFFSQNFFFRLKFCFPIQNRPQVQQNKLKDFFDKKILTSNFIYLLILRNNFFFIF